MGHWPLEKNDLIPKTNPMRADDISGNQISGLIRNGHYDNNGVRLTGEDSYIFLGVPTNTSFHSLTVSWWMKLDTNYDKENGTAVVIQTDRAKIYVRTEAITKLLPSTSSSSSSMTEPISLDLTTVILEDDWSWCDQPDMMVHANPFPINHDNNYHQFVLVLDTDPKFPLQTWLEEQEERRLLQGGNNQQQQNNKKKKIQMDPSELEEGQELKDSIHPELALYMDGHAIASSSNWKIPKAYGSYVHGVWFGSSEPEHSNYQDPWDTTTSLKASFRDIRIWERPLSYQEIQQLAPISFANAPQQQEEMKQQEGQAVGGWQEYVV